MSTFSGTPRIGGAINGGSIISPDITGGTLVGSKITYKSTTGVGTVAGIAHQFVGGTNGATVAVTILNNGNVGIGTTNPTQPLDISTASTSQLLLENSVAILANAAQGGTEPSPLLKLTGKIWNSANGTRTMSGGLQIKPFSNNTNPTVSKLSFMVGTDDAEPTEQMYVTNSGLFGINGGASFTAPSLSSTYNIVMSNATPATSGAAQSSNQFILQGNAWDSAHGSTANQAVFQLINNTSNISPTLNRLAISVNSAYGTPTEAMSLLSNGNVGIGTTAPNAKTEILATTEQLRLSYDATHFSSFTVNSAGDLTIDNTGRTISVNGFYAPQFANSTSISNANFLAPSTGAVISRNIADANTALTIKQSNASSTGLIIDGQFNTVSKFKVDAGGEVTMRGIVNSIATKTTTYTIASNDYTILADATGAAFSITLPTAASAYDSTMACGGIYNIKRINSGANAVTVQANGAELIDGANTQVISTQWTNLTIQSNGTSWFII